MQVLWCCLVTPVGYKFGSKSPKSQRKEEKNEAEGTHGQARKEFILLVQKPKGGRDHGACFWACEATGLYQKLFWCFLLWFWQLWWVDTIVVLKRKQRIWELIGNFSLRLRFKIGRMAYDSKHALHIWGPCSSPGTVSLLPLPPFGPWSQHCLCSPRHPKTFRPEPQNRNETQSS